MKKDRLVCLVFSEEGPAPEAACHGVIIHQSEEEGPDAFLFLLSVAFCRLLMTLEYRNDGGSADSVIKSLTKTASKFPCLARILLEKKVNSISFDLNTNQKTDLEAARLDGSDM